MYVRVVLAALRCQGVSHESRADNQASRCRMIPQPAGYGPPAPVRIFQWEAEFARLLHMYRERAPRRVLEVGTFHGGTLYHWLQNAAPGALVVSVDSYTEGVDNRRLYGDWCPDRVGVIAVEGDSTDPATAIRVARYAPFDWVWIDASHVYDDVVCDWETYGGMCAPGGLVCFHDINAVPGTDGYDVGRLWAELRGRFRTEEIVESPTSSGGGIGIVYP